MNRTQYFQRLRDAIDRQNCASIRELLEEHEEDDLNNIIDNKRQPISAFMWALMPPVGRKISLDVLKILSDAKDPDGQPLLDPTAEHMGMTPEFYIGNVIDYRLVEGAIESFLSQTVNKKRQNPHDEIRLKKQFDPCPSPIRTRDLNKDMDFRGLDLTAVDLTNTVFEGCDLRFATYDINQLANSRGLKFKGCYVLAREFSVSNPKVRKVRDIPILLSAVNNSLFLTFLSVLHDEGCDESVLLSQNSITPREIGPMGYYATDYTITKTTLCEAVLKPEEHYLIHMLAHPAMSKNVLMQSVNTEYGIYHDALTLAISKKINWAVFAILNCVHCDGSFILRFNPKSKSSLGLAFNDDNQEIVNAIAQHPRITLPHIKEYTRNAAPQLIEKMPDSRYRIFYLLNQYNTLFRRVFLRGFPGSHSKFVTQILDNDSFTLQEISDEFWKYNYNLPNNGKLTGALLIAMKLLPRSNLDGDYSAETVRGAVELRSLTRADLNEHPDALDQNGNPVMQSIPHSIT